MDWVYSTQLPVPYIGWRVETTIIEKTQKLNSNITANHGTSKICTIIGLFMVQNENKEMY